MAVRRNDARRRRLVVDPAAQLGDAAVRVANTSSAPPPRKKPTQGNARTYAYGADRRNQCKTTDLIPKRVVSYLLVVLALLTCLWLINFTSTRAHQWASHIGQAGMDALAVRGPGSLAGWFSSFLLIMTGLASLQIYALRKHRCDDYRGTYRLWIWTSGLLILASVSCVSDLGTILVNVLRSVTSGSFVPRDWVPLALKLTVLAVLMGRGAYEVRQSRGSFALVLLVWIAFSAAAVLQLPAVLESMVGLGSETIFGNCVLFGTTALFLAHLTYARFIYLDAHGLIVQRIKKQKSAKRSVDAGPAVAKTTTKAKPKARKKKAAPVEEVEATQPVVSKSTESKPVKQTRKAKKAKAKSTAAPRASAAPKPVSTKQGQKDRSPSDVLKELAAASRAREQTMQQETVQPASHDYGSDDEHEDVISMSKSQRRKQRKMDKQRRRAA